MPSDSIFALKIVDRQVHFKLRQVFERLIWRRCEAPVALPFVVSSFPPTKAFTLLSRLLIHSLGPMTDVCCAAMERMPSLISGSLSNLFLCLSSFSSSSSCCSSLPTLSSWKSVICLGLAALLWTKTEPKVFCFEPPVDLLSLRQR